MMIIVKRYQDEERIKRIKPPMIVYGRRKTGKTFFIKSVFRDALYLFVRRDRSIYREDRNEIITYDEMKRLIEEREEIVIIDEFHRLPDEFLDWLHVKSPCNLILITSTLHLAQNFLSKGSPILGLFLGFQMNLIDERDILLNLSQKIKDGKTLVEQSVYMREPILLRWFGSDTVNILNNLKIIVPSLVGEVFGEEEKELSARYEGILRALSSGKTTLSEVTGFLYSNKLIEKQDTSAVKPYLKILSEIGMVKRIPEYFGKRYYYYVSSPMVDLYYYLDEKYNFSEREISRRYFTEKLPMHVEDFFRELLSKMFDLRVYTINKPNLQIDIALADHKRLKVVCEVKWRDRVRRAEVGEIERKLSRFKDCRKIMIVKSRDSVEREPDGIEVWDTDTVMEQLKT